MEKFKDLLSPQEAWECVKALWATRLRRQANHQAEIEGKGGFQTYLAPVVDWPDGVDRWPPAADDNYMLDALKSALNTLNGVDVRMQDQWPTLAAILPKTIQKVRDAIERAEAELGAQRQPSSVAKIQAETKAVARELENVGGSEQVPTHPADREPTDEEVERACIARAPRMYFDERHMKQPEWRSHARAWLKAWQQVWRESK